MTSRKTFRILRGAIILIAVAAIGIFLGRLVSSYELRFMMNREFCGEYRGIEVYKSGDIDKENCLSFIYALEAMPEELTECCEILYFTAEDLPLPVYSGEKNKALGLTQGSTVYISTEYFSEEVIIHEFFHAYDNYHGLPSESDSFRTAYDAEKALFNIASPTEEAHLSEYFATLGSFYIIYPAEMMTCAPETYRFFNERLRYYE